jgi:AcrR family transcriptional regulator
VATIISHKGAPAAPSRRGEQLLDALERMVLAHGFAHLTVSEMAASLSCSKRTLYELAPSRGDLILRVIARFFERIRIEAASASGHDGDPESRIYDYLQVGVRAAERLSAKAVADIHAWAPARQVWQEHVRLRVDGLTRIIERGIAAGVFRDVQPAFVAEIVFASINRLREPDFYQSTDLGIGEAFDELYGMLIAALTHKSAAPRSGASMRRRRAGA